MTVAGDRAGSPFVMPVYGGGSFADIPGYVLQLLTTQKSGEQPSSALSPDGWPASGARFRRVITLFVDAFGWRFFDRFQDHPLLRRIALAGSVTKLTSQFPSTTSAHVTTLYTGEAVGQHGVFEWFYYEPRLDAVIAPLLFSYAGDDGRETLVNAGVDGAAILPAGQMSPRLARQGVRTYLLQPREFARSTYSTQLSAGARVIPYITVAESLAQVTQVMQNIDGPAWITDYIGSYDAVCHLHGPDRPQSDAELDALLTLIERWLVRDILGRFDDTLVMIIADHGMVETDINSMLYIDQSPLFGRLRPLLRTTERGDIVAPGGSCRDFFLYAQPDHLDEAHSLVATMVGERGDVRRVDAMIEQGYFGLNGVSEHFRSRVGNLIVLPYAGNGIYWFGDGRFRQRYWGNHGGLTPQEMEIPFLLLPAA